MYRSNSSWPRLLLMLIVVVLLTPGFVAGQNQKQQERRAAKKAQQEQAADAVPEPVLIPGLYATLSAEPKEVEVGEPITFELEIHHPRELVPILPGTDLGLGPHWVVLEELGTVTEPSPDQINELGFWITRKRWLVMSLASSMKLPSMEIFFGEGEGALSVLTSEGELSVKTVLGQGDQFPRASKGFRDVQGSLESESPAWWLIASLVTLGLALGWWLFGRKQAKAQAPVEVPALEQLASMERDLPDDLQALQALHYRLTSLVREATDKRMGQSNAGTTDTEWLQHLRSGSGLDEEVERQLAQVIEAAETVKYAGVRPSRYAVEETLKAARGALEGLQNSGGLR